METKDVSPDSPKKCFCARCFLAVDADDKVDIEGQNFHRICSMCCICRNVPKSLKTFYGHVFCTNCFKAHVLSRFREEQRFQSNSLWTPKTGEKRKGNKQSEMEDTAESGKTKPEVPQKLKEDSAKMHFCARCLQTIPQDKEVTIGGQAFHQPCARCYCCHAVPTSSVKIYYGQVFCEDCFNQYVINRDKDNPTEFFKSCFDNWSTNPQFSEHMQGFMSSDKSAASPVVFMMPGAEPYCRCSGSETQQPQPKKCKAVAPDEPCRGVAKAPAAARPAGPLRKGMLWQDTGPSRNGSATLQNVLTHNPLCRDSRNEVHGVSPPRVGRLQLDRNMDMNSMKDIQPIRFDDVAQRFVTTVLDHGQNSRPDVSQNDSESRDSESRDDSLTLENASLRSLRSEDPQRNENESLFFYNGALQQGAGLLKHDSGTPPTRDNGIPERSNEMPKRYNGMMNRDNSSLQCQSFRVSGSPNRRQKRFDKGPYWRDSASVRSDNESLAHEMESLQQDDGSARHNMSVSTVTSMIPLFQFSLETGRPMSPRRRFLRNHEKKMLAAAPAHNAEELEGWDLLSLHTSTAGTETEDRSSIGNESVNLDEIADVAEREKIEKLTQYLHLSQKSRHKNWKTFYDNPKADVDVSERGDEPGWKKEPLVSGWVDIQLGRNKDVLQCPKCLWQSGIFTATSG